MLTTFQLSCNICLLPTYVITIINIIMVLCVLIVNKTDSEISQHVRHSQKDHSISDRLKRHTVHQNYQSYSPGSSAECFIFSQSVTS